MRRRATSRGGYGDYGGFAPYVPVAARRAEAQRHAQAQKKEGIALSPVELLGNKIASSFWGKSWCQNLEAYSDYANRLPRGRTYVRNGSVIDLQVHKGEVRAKVSGSSIYTTTIRVKPIADTAWKALVTRHASGVSSVVDLLQGRLPKSLLEALADRASGLFPSPREIDLACSCPDWASMCKHVAAALYGVGARLDTSPELFFVLRGVEVTDLAARGARVDFAVATEGDLAGADLGALFGIELDGAAEAPATKGAAATRKPKRTSTTAGSRVSKPLAAPPPALLPAPAKPRTRTARAAQPSAAAETVTRASLLASGMTARAIAAWVRSGALEPIGDAATYRIAPVSLNELSARQAEPTKRSAGRGKAKR
jgi:uncharacterized Zn finger protein